MAPEIVTAWFPWVADRGCEITPDRAKRFLYVNGLPVLLAGRFAQRGKDDMDRIGYARVSTNDQNLDLQITALRAAGCGEIFTDQGISGANFGRPGLSAAMAILKPNGMLVVWRLDRLGRSLVDLIQTINDLSKREIEFRSLTENIDTSTSGGRLLFHVMGAMAEFERAIISERTKAGMASARTRGVQIGRRRSLTLEQRTEAFQAIHTEGLSAEVVAKRFGVHPKTLQRYFR